MAPSEPSIVLVDHTTYLADRVADALITAGFDILEAESASDCLDRLGQTEVDGVLTSYALPDLDGVRLSRSIRVTHPNLPLILAPEKGSESIASDAIAAGVTNYVPRELDAHTVVSRIKESFDQTTPWVDDENAKRYHHLLEVSPVAINLFDSTGESIWCNQAVLELLGLDSRDELIGNSIFDFIHPDDHQLATREIQRVTKQKESVGPTEMKLQRADGAIRHIYVSTAIGQFLGEDIGQAIAVDITPLRQVQHELREEQEFIDTALDSLSDVFYVINEEYQLEQWNHTVEDITGYDTSELAERNVLELFVSEDQPRVEESIETVFETGSDTVEAAIITDNGHRELFEFRGRRLDFDDAPKIVGIGRNITEQRERERQLTVLERWLRHNIRNDLNVIQGNAAKILANPNADPVTHARLIHQHAEHLIEQADHQRNVVDIITNSPDPTRLDLPVLVRSLVDRTRDRYPSADIDLSINDSVTVSALPVLNEAVTELLENAIKHNDTDTPTIALSVTCNGEYGTIELVDNGPGIPDMDKDELLIDKEVNQIHHGSGFGLFLSYWMARMSGGTMEISPNNPRGTVITLSLPLADSDDYSSSREATGS